MIFLKKNIKSIKVTESQILFNVKENNENFDFTLQNFKKIYIDFNTRSKILFKVKEKNKNKNFDFILQDVKNIYIGFNKSKSFYFFDFISLLIIGIAVAVNFWFSLGGVFFIGIVGIIFRGVYLTLNKKYFIILKLKNGNSSNFYFSNYQKTSVLEQVKLIRGRIVDINFSNTIKEIN